MRPLALTSLALAALASAALAPAAQAGTPFTIGTGKDPHLVVEPATGTMHAVWVDDPEAQTVRYCRVPRGATGCQITRDIPLALDSQSVDEPFLLRQADGALLIVMTRYVGGNTVLWRSTDAGNSWSAPQQLYKAQTGTDHTEPVLGPVADAVTFADWNSGRSVFSAKLDGSQTATTQEANPETGGTGFLLYNFQIAPTGDGGLIAAADTLDQVGWWRMAPGADPSQSASWPNPTILGPGQEVRVAGGPGGAYLLTKRRGVSPAVLDVRKWTGGGFGAPVAVSGAEGYLPDLAVGPSGAVAAAWRENGSPNTLKAALSTNGGTSFSTYQPTFDGNALFASLDIGLAQDTRGFAVWMGENKAIRAASLDPGGGAYSGASADTTSAVPGADLLFGVPKGCVQPGQTFRVTLRWKRKKRKGNVFVKVNRTDFYIGSKVVKVDRKAPFVQTLTVTASAKRGSKITLRARAFIKVRKGKAPKKSVRTTIRVCP
jgi:hypothetical protein